MFLSQPKIEEDIYIHSRPEYSVLYDVMWDRQHKNQNAGIETWGKNRIDHLYSLCESRVQFEESDVVLDLCCGLGRITAACLELGAGKVIGVDGSYMGLQNARQKLKNLGLSEERFFHVQLDVEKLDECFQSNTFDFVVHYYALQHIRDFRKTLKDIKEILKTDGIVAFNYFTTGTTHFMTNLLREIFLKYDPLLIFNFLEDIGYIKNGERTFSYNDLLDVEEKFDSTRYPFLPDLSRLVKSHGAELVASKIHFEDFTTPYLHNFDHHEVLDYVQRDLGMKILNSSVGRIVAQKIEENKQ